MTESFTLVEDFAMWDAVFDVIEAFRSDYATVHGAVSFFQYN